MSKLRKVFFVLQFSVIFIPFAPLADVMYYTYNEGSVIEGIKALFYDSMLGCSYTGLPRMIVILCISVAIISCILNNLLKKKERNKRSDV